MALSSPPVTRDLAAEGVRPRPSLGGVLQRDNILAYLFMLPGVLILLLFMAYPFVYGRWLSLTDKFVAVSEYDYIGLANYRWFWTDTIFRQSVINTFIYGFVTVPFKLFLGLGLALLLNERFHFSRV